MFAKKQFVLISASIIMLTGMGLVLFSIKDIYIHEKNKKTSLIEAKEKVQIKSQEQEHDLDLQNEQKEIINSFKKGEVIGILEIPKLQVELPIVEGTSEYELEKGVGHYSSTALPGQPDQILLSGHRETVFRRLGDLRNGDVFHVIMPYGSFSYEITGSQIVEANDTTVIKSTAPTETLTVSTCYPFSYIGDAPYRYVLTAHRTEKPVTN
ncbi:class D sortase [Bacillus sp. DTU_2020_1000418_1_SI_GHA_SEK_038]|uniref:class D sortase n=1 Tax=Bacillus sp. DTU_2020_1000418_1_SI_GHA_SEK_038 TaxID=3077585 RepID=UPI0028E9A8F5|nr:class D sortase [Bacillus sp. DTU_2020_1000418_1_SI_GHA_SEK_038]WNS76381.1 class D sortase [Bacillus sp. DTU_2020_1000418_1_SI_GHA_SEK_038]